MDASSKGKPKTVPFQTVTRYRSRAAITSKIMPSPVVVVKKLSPSQYAKRKVSSPKNSQDASAVRISDESKKRENAARSCHPSTSKVDKSSSAPKKAKMKKTEPRLSTKTISAVAKKKTGRPKMANKTNSKTSHSSSDQACKGSKSCQHCRTKDETISYLQSRVKFLEVEEASILRRQPIYEGFGFPRLLREEENHNLMMEKYVSQEKLDKAEAEFQDYVQNEDKEIKMLIHKKKLLKRKLSAKMDLCAKEDAEGKEDIKEMKEKMEKYKEIEAKSKLEIAELEKELAISEKKVEEEKEKWRLQPFENPVGEPFEGPCGICRDLYNDRKGSRIMLAKVKEGNLAIKQQVFDSAVKLKDNACDIAHLSYEIEYIKKRIFTQHLYEKNEEFSGGIDFYDRKDFSVQVCNMMEKNFSSRKYRPVPTSAYPLPRTEFENSIEDLQEEGFICCHKFETPICRRFFCGRVKNKERMTEEERVKYELTNPAELQSYPGRIETEGGRKMYINEVVKLIFDGVPVEKIASIK
ncbi:DNA ligase 1 [Parasteatoda tepidariorum]|uniref:DNA ligase 1 n=1 Tax=Parasteatoda tepidariorum TaxID=114398 RepID=UPI000A2C0179